jgi:hypothetical protein
VLAVVMARGELLSGLSPRSRRLQQPHTSNCGKTVGFTLIHLDSLGSTTMKDRHLLHETSAAVAGLGEASYSIRSCPASATRQNASKYGRIGLIRFDSLGFTQSANRAFSAKGLKTLNSPDHPKPPSSTLCSLRSRDCGTAISQSALFGLIHFDPPGFTLSHCETPARSTTFQFPVSYLRFL